MRFAGTLLLTALLLGACDTQKTPQPAPAPLFSVDENRTIRTRDGETLLLRGVNVRVTGLFDSGTVDEKRPAWVIPADFTAADAKMLREYGFNFLRLPINWSALEPERGSYEESFIDRIRQIVELCEAEGIFVLIDFHQDGFSKWVGQDGAPLWAVRPPPVPGKTDYETHIDPAAIDAHNAFYDNEDGLQDAFADAVLHIDRAFRNAPNVVGIEILNEPIAGFDHNTLLPFYERVVNRVNPENPDRVWFFEPSAMRNQTDEMPLAFERFPARNAVYAPHVYTNVFDHKGPELREGWENNLTESWENAEKEAVSFGAGLCTGEYGAGPAALWWPWYAKHTDLQNKYLAHSAIWVWKEYESWSMFSAGGTVTNTTWTPRTDFIRALSAPFPQIVAGTLTSVTFDRAATEATAAVSLSGTGRVVWGVPPGWYPDGAKAFCDGAPATVLHSVKGRLEAACPLPTKLVSLIR